MTPIIAGTFSNRARIAIDSYLSTAEGEDEPHYDTKLFALPQPAVIAGRGNNELFWIIALELAKLTIPFDDLAEWLAGGLMIDTTINVMAGLNLPPDRGASELFLVGW